MSHNKQMEYSLTMAGKEIFVGATRPKYDNKKRAWKTDVGLFPTLRPGKFSVTVYAEKPQPPSAPQEPEIQQDRDTSLRDAGMPAETSEGETVVAP